MFLIHVLRFSIKTRRWLQLSKNKPPIIKIGIVGNRHGWNYDIKWDILEVINELYSRHEVEIVSGGADGVDSLAQRFAKEYGLKMTTFYPDTSEPSPKRFYDRNKKIADYVDVLLAFNKVKKRSGTQQTINFAKKRGIKVIVYE